MTEQIEKAAEAIWRAAKSNTFGAEPIWSRNWEDVHSKTQELYREMAQAAAAILAPAPVPESAVDEINRGGDGFGDGHDPSGNPLPCPAPVDGDVIERMREIWLAGKDWKLIYHAAVDPTIALHEKEMVRLKELEGNRRFAIAQIPSDVWINSAGTIHVAIRILVDELASLKALHEKEMKLAHLSNGNLVQQLAALKALHEQEYKRCPVCDSLDMISSGPTKYICRHCHDTSVIEKLEAELSAQKDRLAGPVTDEECDEYGLAVVPSGEDCSGLYFDRGCVDGILAHRRAAVSAPKQPTLEELAEIVRYAKARNVVLPPASALLAIIERRTQP